LRAQRLSDQWGEFSQDEIDQKLWGGSSRQLRQAALDQSRLIIRQLLTLGITVIIDTPLPLFRAPAFRCSDWFNHMNPVCEPGFSISADLLKKYNEPVLESLRTLQAEFPSLVIWDPFPILCPGSSCSALKNGKPLFFDQDHLSGYGNLLLLPSFSELLQSINNSKTLKSH
jgi:hypothetical protein